MAFLPALNITIGIAAFVIVRAQTLDAWSDVRLARTFAIYHGIKLYRSPDPSGPIIGALHMPVSELLFGPAVLAPDHAFAAKLLAGSLVAFSVPGTVGQIAHYTALVHEKPNVENIAERDLGLHPQTDYLPYNPLVVFYREHRFYHVDSMLLDRELSGRPITAAQFASQIPQNPARVILPHGWLFSRVMQDYLTGWRITTDSSLPGMAVYERPR